MAWRADATTYSVGVTDISDLHPQATSDSDLIFKLRQHPIDADAPVCLQPGVPAAERKPPALGTSAVEEWPRGMTSSLQAHQRLSHISESILIILNGKEFNFHSMKYYCRCSKFLKADNYFLLVINI